MHSNRPLVFSIFAADYGRIARSDLILMREEGTARLEILSGWKEIASYLGRGVRTVQRYEREMGLPIHRPAGKSSAAVAAIRTELDKWLTVPRSGLVSMAERRALDSRTNKLRGEFLQIDCEIALTFASMALRASTQEKRRRTSQAARKAYDTIMRLRENTELGDADTHKLDANLRRLKGELEKLGQVL